MTDTTDTAAARQLARQARALAEAATPGPWQSDTVQHLDEVVWAPGEKWIANIGDPTAPATLKWDDLTEYGKMIANAQRADCEFIAAARELVPQLADTVERLVDELDALRAAGEAAAGNAPDCRRQAAVGTVP